ncbi:RNB domain-containing ribonuclease [Corynebacterium halotolerans]|uniref:Ribonuclease R n=1 Tax=Corynebacterium halotolerans YIM 70093 = DSM 44683 TaxID=1121362 RepID=M1NNU3_9CORY|nr:RNB domain-containing ribonuclease [Corynebacterium halotolerans]AGF72993.1 ribonuclease R [Corynebacterium halotolerans YIM 70093 = DSM 44683]
MKLYAAPLNFRGIAEEFSVPTGFTPRLHAEAAAVCDRYADGRRDARGIPLVTVDPPGSKDLDQAVFIERTATGYRVFYAIADAAAFIEPGGALEAESLRRGQTIYLPDEPARLHPEELSENNGSLLPGVDRPAVLWTIELDGRGEVERFHLERVLVRSNARLNYEKVHADHLAGTMHPSIELLPEVGRLREASALRRHAINLRLPAQRVAVLADGRFELVIEPRHGVMDWNSEISLLTGMCAGQLMKEHGTGILRTLRPATPEAEVEFRAEARALGHHLDDDRDIGEFLLSVDATGTRGMAVMREAQKLLRGAGYARADPDRAEVHAGIGGYYAHVTAPLRRLVDRFATEYCLALVEGREVPEWVVERTDAVIQAMNRASNLANTVDRACLNLTEATVLAPWVGHNFDAVVLTSDAERDQARILVADPPVLAECLGHPGQGTQAKVSLIRADVAGREVAFAWPAD